MEQILNFVFGLVLGVVLVWLFLVWKKDKAKKGEVASAEASASGRKEKLVQFNKKREEGKEEDKKKILEFLREKGRVSNNDIEKLVSVSDATVTRYMEELEKEGLVLQVGKMGVSVYYELK